MPEGTMTVREAATHAGVTLQTIRWPTSWACHAAANVILTVRRLFHLDNQTMRRYCMTERAVQDVQRAHERLEE